MNYQKILLGTLGGAVVMYLAGWVIWGMALKGVQGNEDPSSMLHLILAMVVTALLYTIIFNRWASISTFNTGAKAGAVIAILAGLGQDLMGMAFTSSMDMTTLLTNVAGNLVWGALAGGAIGWILGRD